MPAPAVIPAPIAYIKVVAVKKLVVGFWRFVEVIVLGFPDSVALRFLGSRLIVVWWASVHLISFILRENGNRSAYSLFGSKCALFSYLFF